MSYVYEGSSKVDTVNIKAAQGDGCIIRTNAGNDAIVVRAGADHYIEGGTGNDKITFYNLEANASYYIDQSTAAVSDRDVLSFSGFSSNEFTITAVGGTLVLHHIATNAEIVVSDWLDRNLYSIGFKDKALSAQQVAYYDSYSNYRLAMAGEYEFQGTNTVTADNSTIIVANSSSNVSLSGSNNSVQIKSGTATLTGGSVISVTGGTGADKLIVDGAEVGSVSLSSGADVITVNAGSVESMAVGNGNDRIQINNGYVGSIDGGAGADTIVVNTGEVGTIKGGAGNDTYIFTAFGENFNYTIDQTSSSASTDRDVLSLENFTADSFNASINGAGELVLETNGMDDAATITVRKWDVNPFSSIAFQDITITGEELSQYILDNSGPVTQQKVILDFMNSLNETPSYGVTAFDEAVVECSRGLYTSAQDLIDNFISDCVNYGGADKASQKAFLLNYCGIDLDNDDTGAISGLDAGGAVEKNQETVVAEAEGISINDLVYNYTDTIVARNYYTRQDQEFTCATINYNGENITFYWDESAMQSLVDNGYINNINTLRTMIAGVIEVWAPAAFDLIQESYGMSLTESGSVLNTLSNGNKGMQICLDYASPLVRSMYTNSSAYNWTAAVSSTLNINYINGGKITTGASEALLINTYYYQNGVSDVSGQPTSGSLSSQYLDRVIAHEMVHGTMSANINSAGNLPLFLREGLAELIHGADDVRKNELLGIANTDLNIFFTSGRYSQQALLEKIFNLSSPNTSMSTYSYAAGYALMRYLAKNVSEFVGTDSGSSSFVSLEGLSGLHNSELDFNEEYVDIGSGVEESFVDFEKKDYLVAGNI